MLGVGYERLPHQPEDDLLQPSTSAPDLGPADRSAAFLLYYHEYRSMLVGISS